MIGKFGESLHIIVQNYRGYMQMNQLPNLDNGLPNSTRQNLTGW